MKEIPNGQLETRVYAISPGGQITPVAAFIGFRDATAYVETRKGEYGKNILLAIVNGTIEAVENGARE